MTKKRSKTDNAYDQLEELRAAEDQERQAENDVQQRARRLEEALHAAQHFVLDDDEDSSAPELFATRWAERWIGAADAVRKYKGIDSIADVDLPTEAVFMIAAELFEMALKGIEAGNLAKELHQHIERLRETSGDGWEPRSAGLKVNGLREFFRYLRRALLPDGAEEPAPTDPRYAGELAMQSARLSNPEKARRVVEVLRRLDEFEDRWILRARLNSDFAIPPTSVDRDAEAHAGDGDRQQAQRTGGTNRYRKGYVRDFVSKRWKPKA